MAAALLEYTSGSCSCFDVLFVAFGGLSSLTGIQHKERPPAPAPAPEPQAPQMPQQPNMMQGGMPQVLTVVR